MFVFENNRNSEVIVCKELCRLAIVQPSELSFQRFSTSVLDLHLTCLRFFHGALTIFIVVLHFVFGLFVWFVCGVVCVCVLSLIHI